MGVLFGTTDDAADLLVPFVRDQGSEATDSEIEEVHRQATLGRLSAAEAWRAVGLEGDAASYDAQYLSYVRLRNGAKEFLKEMQRRQMPVACVTNDVMEWSQKLRKMHGLEAVQPWIVSGEVGVRKPDPGIYEALRRTTGVPYESCLMIDGRVTSLDAARTLGMSTAWFTTGRPPADQRPNHPIVTSFSDFFRRRAQPKPSGPGNPTGPTPASPPNPTTTPRAARRPPPDGRPQRGPVAGAEPVTPARQDGPHEDGNALPVR